MIKYIYILKIFYCLRGRFPNLPLRPYTLYSTSIRSKDGFKSWEKKTLGQKSRDTIPCIELARCIRDETINCRVNGSSQLVSLFLQSFISLSRVRFSTKTRQIVSPMVLMVPMVTWCYKKQTVISKKTRKLVHFTKCCN